MTYDFITKLKTMQDQKFDEHHKEKSFVKRKLVFGVHETLKFAESGKIVAVIYARNFKDNNSRATSNFFSLHKLCVKNNVPLICAMTKRTMARCVQKFPYVSFIGIMNTFGCEKEFETLKNEWKSDKDYKNYHFDQESIFA